MLRRGRPSGSRHWHLLFLVWAVGTMGMSSGRKDWPHLLLLLLLLLLFSPLSVCVCVFASGVFERRRGLLTGQHD